MGEKKKKVLFVATVDSHIELFHVPYLKMFHDKGWEVHVATDTDKKIPYCDKKICLSIKRSPFKFLSNFKAVRKLKKIAQEEGYDIVHCHTPMGSVVARLACKKARRNGTRVIYTAHGFHFYTGAPMHFWLMFYPVEWYLAKFTDTLITINNEDFERAKAKFGKRCRDIQYVPGVGIDPKKFEKKLSTKKIHELRASLGLKDDDAVLICVGRLDKNKNQGLIIKAMKELVAENSKYHLLLAGTDELGGEYQKLAKKLGVSSNVHFLGFCDNVAELMQISDIAVSASKREGLPMNLVEAAYMGLPIVATDCRGNRDVCKMVSGNICYDADNFAKLIHDKNKTIKNNDYLINNVSIKMSNIYFRKKRVLHVLATDRFSGAENVACTIIDNFSNSFDMAYCSLVGPIENKMKETGIRYFGVKKLNRKNLNKIIREYNPDIIHAHDYSASVVAVNSCFSGKIVSHIHNTTPFAKYWNPKTIVYAFSVNRINEVIGVSKRVYDEAIYKRLIKGKYTTLYNYVDKNNVVLKSKEYDCKKKYDLCFIGRNNVQKNPLLFIDIVKDLKKDNNGIKACMIGGGELDELCKETIRSYGLEENISMYGFQDNPFPIIKNSKICVMPSSWEGFGITAIESLVLGKPVFNSGVGGLGEIFENNKELICKDKADYLYKIEKAQKETRLKANYSSIYSLFTDKRKWCSVLENIYE